MGMTFDYVALSALRAGSPEVVARKRARRRRRRGLAGLGIQAKMSERLAVGWMGNTNIRDLDAPVLACMPPTNGGFRGWYTYKRAWPKLRASIAQLDWMWRLSGGKAYLHTWTASPSFAPDDASREAHWRRYVDRVRKEGLLAYLWATEWHEGGGAAHGLKHFHLVTLHAAAWDYVRPTRVRSYVDEFTGEVCDGNGSALADGDVVPLVNAWSRQYCGSTNGLDIEEVHTTVGYGAKYCAKMARDPMAPASASRLWASGGLVKGVVMGHPSQIEALAPRVQMSRPERVRVSRDSAAFLCAVEALGLEKMPTLCPERTGG